MNIEIEISPGELVDRITILEDRDGRLWVATDGGGIDRYDAAADAFLHCRHETTRPTSLASDRSCCSRTTSRCSIRSASVAYCAGPSATP